MAGDLNRSEHLNRPGGKPRRLRSTLGVRLAGAALCTAGLAFIGFGTVGSQWSLFTAKNTGVVPDPGCDSSTTNCLNESFEGSTIEQDKVNCDFTSQFPNEDGFLFVLPTRGNSSPTFVPGTFFAVFQGIGSPVQGTVGVPGVANGDQKFAVVYVPAGSVLEEAYSQATNGTPVFGDNFNVTGGCEATTTTTTSTGSTATISTTKTVTAPGTTVTTTVSGPTTTTTAPGTTHTTTKTVSTATTVTSPTTVTEHTTATNTETTTVNTTVTQTTTAPGTTVTVTTTVPTTVTATTVTTNNHTTTTTVTAPTTVTAGTTLTNTATATTTKTVTAGSASSPASSTSSSSSSTPTSGVAAATTTPSTGSGSDIAFGTGLVLLVAGGGLIAGATRITRRKKS